MRRASEYRITSELFVVPHEDLLILYAPLKGVVAQVNEATAALLRDIQAGEEFDLAKEEEDVLAHLSEVGIVNGEPDPPLTCHEDAPFAPVHVTLFLTDACNLRCVYCYAHGGDSRQPTTLPLRTAKAGIDFVVENARRHGQEAFSVGFHGAGEPTVAWRRLTECVEYADARAEQLGLEASCTTCTNAVMPESHARWIARNTQSATVSVDGLPASHDRQRPRKGGGGSFEAVRRTLEVFDQENFFYAIRATITEENVGEMAEMVEFFDDNFGVGDMQLDPLIPAGRCAESGCRGPSDEEYVREFIRAYETARSRGRMIGFSCLSFTALKTFYCCAASDGFAVTHDGYVTACFEACGPDHPYAHQFLYGRFNEETGAFDLDRERLAPLRRRNVNNLEWCRDCFCKYMCAGDCPIHSLKMGYGMERGVRCEIAQMIARHRLATLVRESDPDVAVRVDGEDADG